MTAIWDKSRRRQLLLACVTALGAFVVVYFANATYHELLLDKVGLSQALVDALGAAAAVLVSFLAQQVLSVARYRDATYGAENALQRARGETARQLEVTTEVSHSLAQVPHLNNILVGQLSAVTTQTESAAFSMVERLQAVDGQVHDDLPNARSVGINHIIPRLVLQPIPWCRGLTAAFRLFRRNPARSSMRPVPAPFATSKRWWRCRATFIAVSKTWAKTGST